MASKKNQPPVSESNRKYLSQADVPSFSLRQAMRIAQAIADNYASKATRPLAVAQAMNMSPSSGTFRMLCGASIAYGLTEGGCNASVISITDLGKRITKPLEEGDDVIAKKHATLKPKVLGEFLGRYDGNRVPKISIAQNVLESMGVPSDQTERVFNLIIDSAKEVGFLREIKGDYFVDLQGTEPIEHSDGESKAFNEAESGELNSNFDKQSAAKHDEAKNFTSEASVFNHSKPRLAQVNNNKVFITHGKNKTLVPQISELLKFGNFEPVVSVERESVSKPVTDKVMDDMRACSAAIIHIEAEKHLSSEDGSKEAILNPNVLIEIGAALALYGRRFILLVQDGVKLPSNLQGLYEVRYVGASLDSDTTLKLLRAFNDIKNQSIIPSRLSTETVGMQA